MKKAIVILLLGLLTIGCVACSQTKSETTDLLEKGIENFKNASSYKIKLTVTTNMNTQEYPELQSGDSINYVEYMKEPFQMLIYPDVVDHQIYSLISKNESKVTRQNRHDDENDTKEVSKSAIEGNKAYYGYIIDLISQNKKNFNEEESSGSLSDQIRFKGNILPEQAKNLYQNLQKEYGTSENEIPNLGFYINSYQDISSGSQPLPAVVTIDKKTNQIIKIEVDTTNAMKEADLKARFVEVNEENLKSSIILESSFIQEFSEYNQVTSIKIP